MANFKRTGSQVVISDLRRTVENFSQRLRREFHQDIERDAREFKQRTLRLLRLNLPPQRGRPSSHPVTRAYRLRARKKSWAEVYRACLPLYAGARERFNLRVAVRMRRLRLRKRVRKGDR